MRIRSTRIRLALVATAVLTAAAMPLAALPAHAGVGAFASDPQGDIGRAGDVKKTEVSDLTKFQLTVGDKDLIATYTFKNHRKGTTPHFFFQLLVPDAGLNLYVSKQFDSTAGLYDGLGGARYCDADVERDYGKGGTLEVRVPNTCLDELAPVRSEYRVTQGDVGFYNDPKLDGDEGWDAIPQLRFFV